MNKINYLIITDLGYPMGGGESYMKQTCIELADVAKSYWLSFSNYIEGRHATSSVVQDEYFTSIRSATDDIDGQIRATIADVMPDLIHTQGAINHKVKLISEELGVPCIVGYHFWTNFIDLQSNIDIIKNIDNAKLSPCFGTNSAITYEYVASEFMEDVYHSCGGVNNLNVIYPLSSELEYLVDRKGLGSYVLQMNIAPLKGGEIFLNAAKSLPEIDFVGVITESANSDNSEFNNIKNLCLREYDSPKKLYVDARVVMIPSLVDETFCRVAYEAVMNGIPVISTKAGFLNRLLGDSGVFLEQDGFVSWLKANFNNEAILNQIANNQKRHLVNLVSEKGLKFREVAIDLSRNNVNNNIGIFCSWGDQGQGNHAHLYAKVLRDMGKKVHIFSFQPYQVINKSLTLQSDPNDWSSPLNADSIYYSYNNREEVGFPEFQQFLRCNNIRKLIMLEVCWATNWKRLYDARNAGYAIFVVPLIEIVLKNEVQCHNDFNTTLCCTKQTVEVLSNYEVNNLFYIGHGYKEMSDIESFKRKVANLKSSRKIKFLHVAGHNPVHRKNTKKVINAFVDALKVRNDIHLTITSTVSSRNYVDTILPNDITIIDTPLPRSAIEKLYEECDISIQVSSHEGLGLGFLESLQKITPVITLNGCPHNEFIEDGVNGKLLECWPIDVPDNDNSLVNAWGFNIDELTKKIVMLDKPTIQLMMHNIFLDYNAKYSVDSLSMRLSQSILSASSEPAIRLIKNSPKLDLSGTPREHIETPTLFTRIGRKIDKLLTPITSRINYRLRRIVIDAIIQVQNTTSNIDNASSNVEYIKNVVTTTNKIVAENNQMLRNIKHHIRVK